VDTIICLVVDKCDDVLCPGSACKKLIVDLLGNVSSKYINNEHTGLPLIIMREIESHFMCMYENGGKSITVERILSENNGISTSYSVKESKIGKGYIVCLYRLQMKHSSRGIIYNYTFFALKSIRRQ